jgi:hypothetical protein
LTATLFIVLAIAFLLDKNPDKSLLEAMRGEWIIDTVMALAALIIVAGWVLRIQPPS